MPPLSQKMPPLSRLFARLTTRRSRRAQLWACVYSGVVGDDGETR